MGMMNRKAVDVKPKLVCGPSRTKQEFREECDINNIMQRYRVNGTLPSVSPTCQPIFADCVGIGDYASCIRKIRAAEESFNALPVKIRARFGNEPAQLVGFLQDPANVDEGRALGLLEKPVVVEAPPVVHVPPVVPAPSVEPPK